MSRKAEDLSGTSIGTYHLLKRTADLPHIRYSFYCTTCNATGDADYRYLKLGCKTCRKASTHSSPLPSTIHVVTAERMMPINYSLLTKALREHPTAAFYYEGHRAQLVEMDEHIQVSFTNELNLADVAYLPKLEQILGTHSIVKPEEPKPGKKPPEPATSRGPLTDSLTPAKPLPDAAPSLLSILETNFSEVSPQAETRHIAPVIPYDWLALQQPGHAKWINGEFDPTDVHAFPKYIGEWMETHEENTTYRLVMRGEARYAAPQAPRKSDEMPDLGNFD